MRLGLSISVLLFMACARGEDETRPVTADGPPPVLATPPTAQRPDTAISDTTRAGNGAYRRSYTDPFMQHAYTSAVKGCFYYPPDALAKQFDTSNSREAIARAYSMLSEADAHREAAYLGCLEGLAAPGAGQRKPFDQSVR